MTLDWAAIKEWRGAPLEQGESQLKACIDQIQRMAEELQSAGRSNSWQGEAANASVRQNKKLLQDLDDFTEHVVSARRGLVLASDQVTSLEGLVRSAESFAAACEFSISASGAVVDPGITVTGGTAQERDAIIAQRRAQLEECAQLVQDIMDQAADIDAQLLASLKTPAVSGAQPTKPSSSPPPEPPAGKGTARENAEWWTSLTKQQKSDVIKNHPEWIANRDGVSFTARNKANRILIPKYEADLRAQEADLQHKVDSNIPMTPGYDPLARQKLEEVRAKIKSIETLKILAKKADRQIVGIDFSRDRAQAIVVQGNLDEAEYAGVYTPGLSSTVDSMEANDQRLMDLRNESTRRLREQHPEMSISEAQKRTATVYWLGYQAPQTDATALTSNSVALSYAARDGGHRLAEFYRGINSSHSNDIDITAMGHSYGSTTTGYALREETGVDRAVLMGSPGISAHHLGSFKVPKGQMYYLEAPTDAVGDLGTFGGDPSTIPGIKRLKTKAWVAPDGTHLEHSFWHSQYLTSGTTSQYNLARLLAGQPESTVGVETQKPTPPPIIVLPWRNDGEDG